MSDREAVICSVTLLFSKCLHLIHPISLSLSKSMNNYIYIYIYILNMITGDGV